VIRRIGRNATAAVFCLVWIFPVYWMVLTAFKPAGKILQPTPQVLPVDVTLDNFADALAKPGFVQDLVNSVVVVVAVVALSIVVAFLAATALTRFRFFGRRGFLVGVLVLQMVPVPALVIPLFLGLKSAHLLDTLPGLVLTYVALVLPFTIWTLRGFLHGIPVELEEAAMVDGAGRMRILMSVIVPVVSGGIAVAAIFAFLASWNEFLFSLLLTAVRAQTTPIVIANFQTQFGLQWGPMTALAMLYTVPVVAITFLLQKRIVGGLTLGAVKG
jgi:N,N'-diacetylchitobiose transport system permease protein